MTQNSTDKRTATSLLNYGHIHSGFSQPWAVSGGHTTVSGSRPWILNGNAFGVIAWTTDDAAYSKYYSDDDARGILGAIVTAGVLKSPRWHSTITAAVLGNLRLTSRNGFGFSSSGFDTLPDWRSVYNNPGLQPGYSPHYVSYIWACFLWGYNVSGYEPLYQRAEVKYPPPSLTLITPIDLSLAVSLNPLIPLAKAGIRIMMEGYPSKWAP